MLTIHANGSSDKRRVRHYTIMHKDTPVLEFDRETDNVTVFNAAYLPFGLRGKKKISAVSVFEWKSDRADNLNRTYMNLVYIARKVGRDRDKVIKDSSAISFTDNFGIKTNDSAADWTTLKKLRDDNLALNNITHGHCRKAQNHRPVRGRRISDRQAALRIERADREYDGMGAVNVKKC